MFFFFNESNSNKSLLTTENNSSNTDSTIIMSTASTSFSENSSYQTLNNVVVNEESFYINSSIENVAKWFLNISPLSHKKLQKLCYYAYCWFIVFFNDIEVVDENSGNMIQTLCNEKFQAWIHGPVCPELYQKYKKFGWQDIPRGDFKPEFNSEIENLLNKVWITYGNYSADQLEALSHTETPWINARKDKTSGDICSNEISPLDILRYYSKLS